MSHQGIDKLALEIYSLGLMASHPDYSHELSSVIRAKGGVDRAIGALLREFFPTGEQQLVHGLFNRPDIVLRNTLERLATIDLKIDQFTWIDSRVPFGYTDDTDVGVALDVTLGNLQETHEFAWSWAASTQQNSELYDVISTEADNLRLLKGSEDFRPFTLHWRRIKLDANPGMKPIYVRNPQSSPGVVLIFMAAQHPARVRAIRDQQQLGWFIPGLEYKLTLHSREHDHDHVSYVIYDSHLREIRLGADDYNMSYDFFSNPIFWESGPR